MCTQTHNCKLTLTPGEGALRHSNSRDFVRTFAILMLKQRLGPGGMARLGPGGGAPDGLQAPVSARRRPGVLP